jgi:CTP-dependent riboflavin kinase
MMNQRIEEFAKQCYVKTGSPHTDHFEYWKFAELIVRECAEVSEQSQWLEAKGEYYEGFNEAMIYVANKIKQHFGVE